MLSIGVAAFLANGAMLPETFSANFQRLDGASGHPDTMTCWQQPKQAEVWASCHF
jgi:hypothetical protein